jgi:hypothetical protein
MWVVMIPRVAPLISASLEEGPYDVVRGILRGFNTLLPPLLSVHTTLRISAPMDSQDLHARLGCSFHKEDSLPVPPNQSCGIGARSGITPLYRRIIIISSSSSSSISFPGLIPQLHIGLHARRTLIMGMGMGSPSHLHHLLTRSSHRPWRQ